MTPPEIFNAIAQVFPVKPEDLTGNRRRRNEADSRKCAAYIMHHYLRMSNSQVDDAFGRSRGAGLHARKAAVNLIETDKQFRSMVDRVVAILGLNVEAAA
jgi:chromosomal replication initiation ATPase DnaA